MAELVCGTDDREAWLAARREGITATDIVTIMGLVSWDSPWALYHRKLGLLPEVEQTDRMRLGSWLEAHIVSEFDARTTFLEFPRDGGLYRSRQRPWQLATPDRCWSHDGVTSAVLECKTSPTRDGWGEDGSADVPAYVRAQVLWQMDTLDVATGHVAVVFLPSGEFRSYTITHAHGPDTDHAAGCFMACPACCDIDEMRNKGTFFYNRLTSQVPPPLDGGQPTLDAVKYLNSNRVKGKAAVIPADLAQQYMTLCDDIKDYEAWKREAESEIRQLMGDAQYASWDLGVFARRDVYKRAGYTVPPGEVDRLVRVKGGKADDD